MAKGTRGRCSFASRQSRSTPYPPPSYNANDVKVLEKKDWEDATCSVCMECPHNAVLLLCSSHEKGCRPYMCGTSVRYSNCLDQYKKAYTKLTSCNNPHPPQVSLDSPAMAPLIENCEAPELACPLCRGQVKGWTVVESARSHLNAKKRSCMQDNCLFTGTYKELRKHVKSEHPSAKPREVDPCLEQKWRSMEREREREDVISTIRSSMPGAVVLGDYVIEGSHFEIDSDDDEGEDGMDEMRNGGIEISGNPRDLMSMFVFLQAFGSGARASSEENRNNGGDDGLHGGGRNRIVLGQSGRGRRNRNAR